MSTQHGSKVDERTPLLVRSATVSSSASNVSLTSSGETSSGSDRHPGSAHSKRIDEEAQEPQSTPQSNTPASIARIISVLLIGGFISNADGSLVLATHPVIASEFDALNESSWLLTSFALAAAATQPLYGKLSDIYGRKALLLCAYFLFGLGCALMGIGTTMWHVILGRAISGAGSSGMTALVSILITDLVPLRDVASWRSYVNVVATTGRSLGGPLGGFLADTVGWRWSFFGQAPLAFIAIILVWYTLPNDIQTSKTGTEQKKGKLGRVDFLGAGLMTLAILSFLLPLEIGGVRLPWSHPLIPGLLAAGLVFALLFLATEAYVAREPIFPLELLKQREAIACFLTMGAQVAAQMGLMFAVPLYFQVTQGASNTVAGAHLFPAVAGNAVGGILSGLSIRRTGRYKSQILLATLFAAFAYLLLILRWHGHTNWLESLYIIPGGFGTGVAQSAVFIALQAGIDPKHTAVAAAALYLSSSVGMVTGMAGVSATLQEMLRRGLVRRIGNFDLSDDKKMKIIERAVSDVHYIDHASPTIAKAVIGAYVEALTWTHVASLVFALFAFFSSLFLRQHKLW
ncbi:major facilitator superfamily transporter [Lophiotrema nucula]|uniref:Major facilitator superfamily transporter n=1 Tax=Lophiotrema nucula TaxID=690887 RepID=A0A6A5ZJA8_9PLEO|nr:major facilitator superfamily transporter [Lophiotrema nucula]